MDKEHIIMDKNGYDNNLELRSEKVRKLLGDMPTALTRLGMAVIIIIFIILLAVVCLVPYPHSDGESILHHLIS